MTAAAVELPSNAEGLDVAFCERDARHLAPPPVLTVSEWADRFRRLSREASAEPGQWRTDRAPYQREIMDAFSEALVERVVVMSSAQVGKSEILLNVAGYFIHQDPAPMLMVQPTIRDAEDFSKLRVATMLRDSPELAKRVADPRSRASGNTLLVKEFDGGFLSLVGANAPSGLAGRPIRVVLKDEKDRYPKSAGSEGDPSALADKRTSTFWNRKIGEFSTPTLKKLSPIEDAFEEGDQRRFYVPCPDCGHMQILRWGQLKYDNDDPATAAYCCEGCGVLIDEASKRGMLQAGEWRAHAPFNGIASFHLNALYSPWARWSELVKEFLRAQKDPTLTQVFVNTVLGETYEDTGSYSSAEGLMGRREVYEAPIPEGVRVVTVGADVQPDRIEAIARGWGAGEETWMLARGIFLGDSTIPETEIGSPWEQLTRFRQEWHAAATCVDSGYNADAVYRYAKPRYLQKVWVTRGYSTPGKPLVTRRPSVANRAKCRVFYVGADTGKDSVFGRLKVSVKGALFWHFPMSADRDYFEQLTAERRERRLVNGRWVSTYKCPEGRRNEVLDCEVLNFVALRLLNPDLDAPRSAALPRVAPPVVEGAAPDAPDDAPPPRPAPSRPAPKRRKGWITKW